MGGQRQQDLLRDGGAPDDWTIPRNVIDTYCFVMTTFTLPQHYHSKIGQDAASVRSTKVKTQCL